VLIFFAVGLLAVTILAHKYQQKYYLHGNTIVPGLPIYFIRFVIAFTSEILRAVCVLRWAEMMLFFVANKNIINKALIKEYKRSA
jgi:hypothetical protein